MKSLLAIIALSATMINTDVEANPAKSNAKGMCSEVSVQLSIKWSGRVSKQAKSLREALTAEPKVEGRGWRTYRNSLLRHQSWLIQHQSVLIAEQSAIHANEAMENIILQCEMLKRLGLST